VQTDDEEFAEFVRSAGIRLFRVAYLLTGDRHRGEDLTQDALARTYGAWRRVRTEDAFAYARRVLVNLQNDWWRSHRWRESPVAQVDPVAGAPDPAVDVASRDEIVRALRLLTQRERAVVVLRYFADMSEAAVADELGVALGTVKSTASRALAKLRVTVGLINVTTVEGQR
jgi:RNA polymerase sigma-70 factor (sigma-E family)